MAKLLRAIVWQPSIFSASLSKPREIVGSARLHARRDLLGEEFKQKLSHARPASGQAARRRPAVFSHASQQALRQLAHAQDVGLALGHRDDAARIEQIEERGTP